MGLEHRQVQDRLIHFHLTEVRIYGGINREIAGDAELDIQTDLRFLLGLPRMRRVRCRGDHFGGGIRHELKMERGNNVAYPFHRPPAGNTHHLGPRDHDPFIGFLFPADVTAEVDPPRAATGIRLCKAKGVVWDFKFRTPSIAVDAGLHPPDRIPPDVVHGSILRQDPIALHTGDVRHKHKRCLSIVIRVDHDAEPVGLRRAIPARQLPYDLLRVGIVTGDSNIQRTIVVENANGGDFRR